MLWKSNTHKELALKTPGRGVDFHMHTIASDGMWTPETLVETAVSQGLRVMTVSDHDTIKSVRPVQELAARHGLTFVPGVELTIDYKGAMYHMLVFNFNPDHPGLKALLQQTDQQVQVKKEEMVEALHKRGYKLHRLDELKREDGNYIPLDIAKALHRGSEVATLDQALRLCSEVGLDKVCSQPAELALEVSLAAGGVPIMAHPGREEYGFKVATLPVLEELAGYGLAGLEVYHYSHQPADVARYREFAGKHGLLISAGSDSHNENRKPAPWNPELTRGLLERLNLEHATGPQPSAAS